MMNTKIRNIAVVAVAAASLFMVSTNAISQSSGSGSGAGKATFSDLHFGTVSLNPTPMDFAPNGEWVEIALLLPAVQKVREAAARMQIMGEGGRIDIPLIGGPVPTIKKLKIWATPNPRAGGYLLKIGGVQGESHEVALKTPDFSLRILATDSQAGVESGSARHHAIGKTLLADGSTRPVLIGLLLPAIQKIR